MLTCLLIVYAVAAVITWLYAGYTNGIEISMLRKQQAETGQQGFIQINYVNTCFQGICWPAFWMVFVGAAVFKKRNRTPAVQVKQ